MIQAAHQEHDDQAQPVNQCTEQAEGRAGLQQQEHQPRDAEQGADAVGNGVADLLHYRPFRRLVDRCGTFFHPDTSSEKQQGKDTTKPVRIPHNSGRKTIDRGAAVLIKSTLIIRREDTRDAAG